MVVLILFGCEPSGEGGLEINIGSNTRVDFFEFDLNTTNLIIDSLRTDWRTDQSQYSTRVISGSYENPLLGSVNSTAYMNYRFVGGDILADTMTFDSLVMFFRVDQILKNTNENFDKILLYNLTEEVFLDAVYLSDFDVTTETSPIDTLFVVIANEEALVKNFLDYFGNDLFQKLTAEDSLTLGYSAGLALVPFEQTESLIGIDPSDSTFFSVYAHDDSLNSYSATFAFNTYFTGIDRIRDNSPLSGSIDLDTIDVSDDFAVVNPLFGVTTLVDLKPVIDFLAQSDNILVNRAEFSVQAANSADPLGSIRYYFYNENYGIRGEGLSTNPYTTAVLTNNSYISNNPVILRGDYDSLGYVSDFTLFTEFLYDNINESEDLLAEKIVITGDRFLNLEESLIDLNSVKLKIYYTTLN